MEMRHGATTPQGNRATHTHTHTHTHTRVNKGIIHPTKWNSPIWRIIIDWTIVMTHSIGQFPAGKNFQINVATRHWNPCSSFSHLHQKRKSSHPSIHPSIHWMVNYHALKSSNPEWIIIWIWINGLERDAILKCRAKMWQLEHGRRRPRERERESRRQRRPAAHLRPIETMGTNGPWASRSSFFFSPLWCCVAIPSIVSKTKPKENEIMR